MSRWKPASPLELSPAPAAAMARQQLTGSTAAGTPRLPTLADLPAHCDPYLRWAVLSQWRGFVRGGLWLEGQSDETLAQQRVRIIVKADQLQDLQALSQLAEVPGFYGDGKTSEWPDRHVTASLQLANIGRLLKSLPRLQWELSAPMKDQNSGLPGSALGYFGRQEALDERQFSSVLSGLPVAPVAAGSVIGGTIAVIDFGCPLLHNCLADRSGENSRLAALWDQGVPPVKPGERVQRRVSKLARPWQTPDDAGYGRELSAATLQAAWKRTRQPTFKHDEARTYVGLNYMVDYAHPRRRIYPATHGAHVLDVAGGSVDPSLRHTDPSRFADQEKDAASDANLVFVQLPEDTVGDSSGGSLAAHLLDALRYIFHVTDTQSPLVVNISYGSTGGPHDGSSLIESAMDELLEQRPNNTAIVLAAGNSRIAGLHVRRQTSAQRHALFRVAVVAEDSTDSFVEFWYQKPETGQLEFRARGPGGEWSVWLRPDQSVELVDSATKDCVAAFVHQAKVLKGKRSMALLALRPTEAPDGDDSALAQPGVWEVEARLNDSTPDAQLTIDAWVERDDPRPFSGRKQTAFLGLEPADADDTLSSIATGEHTVVVGGFRGSDGVEAAYSSTGPRRKGQWPMTHALCESDLLQQGLRAAAVRSGETLVMNGTSVAAPVMARRIYNLFQEPPVSGKAPPPMARAQLLQRLTAESKIRGALIRVDS